QSLRVQSMREAIASRLTSGDNDRLARAKRGADEPRHLVEEESIVHVELHGVLSTDKRRERGQEWHGAPALERVVDRTGQIRIDSRLQYVAMPACAHGRGDEFVRAMHGEKHDS